jgi:hypothetical protein
MNRIYFWSNGEDKREGSTSGGKFGYYKFGQMKVENDHRMDPIEKEINNGKAWEMHHELAIIGVTMERAKSKNYEP